MTLYDDLISVAKKMNDFSISIERDNDPAIIRNLKQEEYHLKVMADELKKMITRSESDRNYALRLQRMLFYELFKQNDEPFIQKALSVLDSEDFEWKAKHQMFTDREITDVMKTVIKESELL